MSGTLAATIGERTVIVREGEVVLVAPGTGEPLLRIDVATAAAAALGEPIKNAQKRLALYTHRQQEDQLPWWGIEPHSLAVSRWAVVINAREDADLIKALWPLIEHRMRQMGHSVPPVS